MTIRSSIYRLCAVACILTGAVVAVLPGTSSADAPAAVGYWSRPIPLQADTVQGQSSSAAVVFNSPQQIGPVTTLPPPVQTPTIPPPPVTLPDPGQPNPIGGGVPDGGFWIANDLTGPSAISALRFSGDIGEARLVIKYAQGTTTAGKAVACPALSDWAPDKNGPWNNRPAHDCDRIQISGRVMPDGTGLEFTLPEGFNTFGTGITDVILLPDPISGDVFSAFFEAPSSETLEVFTTSRPSGPTTTTTAPPPAVFDPGVGTSFVSPSSGGSSGGGNITTFDPTTSEFTTTETETAAPTIDTSGGAAQVINEVTDVIQDFTESRVGRIISVLLLFGLGFVLFYLGGQEARMPRLIGGLAVAGPDPSISAAPKFQPRGIGRFRLPRDGSPNRL